MKQFPTHIVAVDGIVVNENNEILLVKHRDRQIWTIPGGQVEVGENLIDAREVTEAHFMSITLHTESIRYD